MQVPHAGALPSALVLAAHEVGEKLGWIYPGQNLQTVGTDLKFDCQTKINKNAVSHHHHHHQSNFDPGLSGASSLLETVFYYQTLLCYPADKGKGHMEAL